MSEEEMHFSSLSASEVCSQMPQASVGETITRRRRKKVKGDAKKRGLSDEQTKLLEMSFRDDRTLESGRKAHLAAELGLDAKQVAVWFQNRRARHKNKQMEEAYIQLKSEHATVVVEKCQLEKEALSLKEKLLEAEEEIRKLWSAMNGASRSVAEGGSGSPSSSFSTFTLQPLMGGEFAVERDQDFIYNFNNYVMEWPDLYSL